MANKLAKHYDVVISGGGIVGLTLLNSILRSKSLKRCDILLIEQASKQPPQLMSDESQSMSTDDDTLDRRFSNRVSSLTLSTRHYFDHLGVWKHLESHTKRVRTIRAWNYDYNHRIEFKPTYHYSYQGKNLVNKDNTLFSVVENYQISDALNKNLEFLAKNVSYTPDRFVAWNSTVESVLYNNDGTVEIKGKNHETGEDFTTNSTLLVGCDGFKSTVRQAANFKYYEKNLNKTAIVGTVQMESRHPGDINDIAYQRFSAHHDTVAALLPLDERFSSFVISAPTSYAEKLINANDDSFIEEFNYLLGSNEASPNPVLKVLHEVGNFSIDSMDNLQKKIFNTSPIQPHLDPDFWYDCDGNPPRLDILVSGSRASYPLFFGTTSPYMVGRIPGSNNHQTALIGDAAHRVHPLAGQGLNLGITDAMVLSDELEISASNGENLFNPTDPYPLGRALDRFQKRRQLYIVPMMASIYTLPAIFNTVPSKALSIFDAFECIKNNLVKYAS